LFGYLADVVPHCPEEPDGLDDPPPLGLGAGAVPVTIKDEESGTEESVWQGTLVDATRGVLRTSRGRQRDGSGDSDKVGMDDRSYA